MKYTILGFLIFLVTANFSYSQTAPSTEKMKYQINFVGPGGAIEFKINNKSTGLINLGLLPAFNDKDIREDFFLTSEGTTVIPFIDLQYRYFYNIDRRKKLGKSINQNSGNFIALKSIFYLFSTSKYYDSTDNLFGIGRIYGYKEISSDHGISLVRQDWDSIILTKV